MTIRKICRRRVGNPRSLILGWPLVGGKKGRYQGKVEKGWGQKDCPDKVGMPMALEVFRTPS